eukprot:2879961-Pyramimonas_sp.AAC.1
MHSIVGMENVGNKQFLAILAGRPIPGMMDVAMALEDGVIEADDDGAVPLALMDGAADVDPAVGPDAGEAGGVAAAPVIALP